MPESQFFRYFLSSRLLRQRRTAAVYRSRRYSIFQLATHFDPGDSRVRLPPLRQYQIHLRRCPRHPDLHSTPPPTKASTSKMVPNFFVPKLKSWRHYQNLGTYNLFRSSLSDECRDKPDWTSATNRSALTLFEAERDHFKSALTKVTTPITMLATVRNSTSPWAICAWLFRTAKKKY